MSNSREFDIVAFGSRLRSARKQKHATQGDVARYLGITTATFSRYERGEVKPSIDVLTSIVEFFFGPGPDEITADWLLFGDPSRFDNPNPVTLENFGTLTGFRFGNGINPATGGYAEVSFHALEVVDILGKISTLECGKDSPDERLMECLDYCRTQLCEQFENNDFIAQVVIAKNGVSLTPVFPKEVSTDLMESANGKGARSEDESST